MARKTNKTAHVLNLISKAKDEHQAMEEQMQIDNTGLDVSNDLLFMGIEPANDKSIAEKIDENLKVFVEQEENGILEETIPTQNSSEYAKEENVEKAEQAETPVSQETNLSAREGFTNDVTEKILAPMPEEGREAPIPPENHTQMRSVETPTERVFHYLNVYERLVLERLEEFQNMFGVCPCQRCKADIISIALSNLPAKYIVTDNPRIIPLLSFYREKYKTAVAAQLSNACVMVKQNPLH
ncbi:late competence development protein ComFB [Anaerotignum neopropionicum]|uniref:Late competence development protein ComFB n=1 Tax=Anaerotignum neopropionicum TaxID=36847 RepID=A0A136WJ55_9FIRM|nr:late competence development ComFB family protein [Anaerotignum neopropionicum]KXL54561.1 late competence development protein ComFB [Anaerotignum neopropionicum]